MFNETYFIKEYCLSLLEEDFKNYCSQVEYNNFLYHIIIVLVSFMILLILIEILKNKKKMVKETIGY